MSDFLPVLFLILIFGFLGRGKKKTGSGGGKTAPAGRRNARPESRSTRTPGSVYERKMAEKFPNLFRDDRDGEELSARGGSPERSSPEGTDPCHDDMNAMRSGSLEWSSPEGTDPCHDDRGAVQSGSLEWSVPEGADPCHDNMPAPAAARREDESEPAAGGLNLAWTGSEIVKGFVYGEVLNRRRA